MLRIRFKMGPARNKEWTCCFGFLHVRTTTILIGSWHLVSWLISHGVQCFIYVKNQTKIFANESFLFQFLNVLTLGILAAIIRNPDMMQELESGYDNYARLNEALPTPLPFDPPYAYRDHSLNYRENTYIYF